MYQYIPKINIVETGYTQGYQYKNPFNEFYKGFYHKDTSGKYWTGEEHNQLSLPLTNTISNNPITIDYINKNNIVSKGFTKNYNNSLDTPLLRNDAVIPTEKDYNNGVFIRYVAQLKASTNPELNIVELNSETFDKVSKDISVIKSYKLVSFGWKLTGPINDVYDNNIRIESGVEDTNLRSLQEAEKTITKLSSVITDPLQFSFSGVPKADNAF